MKNKFRKIYSNRKLTAKFLAIGCIGFASNYAVLSLSTSVLHLNKIVAELIAAAVALQVTFLLHDRWTYRIDKNTHTYHLGLGGRYWLYIVSNSFGSLLTVGFFAVFSGFLAHFPALVLGAIAGLVWNFLMNKTVIWRNRAREAVATA